MKKKITVLALILICAFAITGCGSSTAASSAGSSNGTLVMATNAAFPPYEYIDGDDYAGIDIDLARVIANRLDMELEIQDIDFNTIIPSIKSGEADMGIAGITRTEEREKNVSFSDTYATGIQVIVVKNNSSIKGPDDLEGRMIGVQEATTGYIYCEDDYGTNHITSYATGAEAIDGLKNGEVDCVVIDNRPAEEFVKAKKGLKILETEYVEEEYAIAVNKDNTELLEQINDIIAEMKDDGSLQAIIDKYINAE